MKKTIIMLVSVLTTFITNAQDKKEEKQSSKTTFGLRFGGNMNKIIGKNSAGGSLKEDFKLGANIGINAAIPLASDFFFQPGIVFTNKGSKRTEKALSQTITSTTYITYIEVPLNIIFKPAVGTGTLLIGAGPYGAYGILGQFKQSPGTNEKIKFKNSVKNTDPNIPYLKPMDAGVNILVGYQLKNGFSFQLNGQLGLLKINPEYVDEPTDKSSYKNIGVGISIGYRFQKAHARK